MRDFQSPGRSAVRALNGMASTSHPLASQAAVEILKAGGNAVDAAIAASAVLCVVEPQSTGIGGDCFALVAPEGSADIVAVNGSGRAPARATVDWYLERKIGRIPHYESHAVTVPGAIDAWATLLDRFGTMELGRLLGAAIDFADDGYVVHERVARDWQLAADKLARDENAARIFLPGGKAPAVGDVHRQPDLAATLRTIAAEGRDGFYRGPIAEDIVGYLNSLDGLHSLEDFATQETEVLAPISTTYRGHQVFVVPPNNPGITALLMLNILKNFSFAGLDPLSIERFHLEGEATRLAFNVRETYLGDPRQAEVPVENLLSKDFAQVLAREVSRDRAMALEAIRPPGHPDTIYLSVVDKDRNAVSFINSTFHPFGSGLCSPTGVVLQNRGSGFRLEPGHPNCIAPGKRPLHTIMPGMLARNGRAVMPYGVMGGHFQPVGQVHVLTNMLDFGMDPQAAIDCPRGFHFNGVYGLESGVPVAVAAGLSGLGHSTSRVASPFGGGQAIWIDWQQGTLAAGSDPRKDGCAIGY